MPFGGVDVRPRAVTYTRENDKEIKATQMFPHPSSTGDYCWVVVNGITFVNVYKAPKNPEVIQLLTPWSPLPLSTLAGDFISVY